MASIKVFASHDEVISDHKLFWQTLQDLHNEIHSKLSVPTVGGRALDLHFLYAEVTKRGGYREVGEKRKWKEVSREFGFKPTMTMASTILKRQYAASLCLYEDLYFHRVPYAVPAVVDQTSSLPSVTERTGQPEPDPSSMVVACSNLLALISRPAASASVPTVNVVHQHSSLPSVVMERTGQPEPDPSSMVAASPNLLTLISRPVASVSVPVVNLVHQHSSLPSAVMERVGQLEPGPSSMVAASPNLLALISRPVASTSVLDLTAPGRPSAFQLYRSYRPPVSFDHAGDQRFDHATAPTPSVVPSPAPSVVPSAPNAGAPILDFKGTVEGKFDGGYLVSAQVGSQAFKGVLFHQAQPSAATVTQTPVQIPAAAPVDKPGRRKRKIRRGGDGLPKQTRTAYNYFIKEKHGSFKAEFPNRKPSEILSLVAAAWNRLTPEDRTVYRRLEREDTDRFNKEKTALRGAGTSRA